MCPRVASTLGTLRRWVVALVIVLAGSYVLNPAAAQTPGPPTKIESDLLAVKEQLDGLQRRQLQVQSELDALDAQLADIDADIVEARAAIGRAETAVLDARRRLSVNARTLLQRPGARLQSLLDARSANEYVLGQLYLERAVGWDAAALESYKNAKSDHSRLRSDLQTRRAELRALQEQRRRGEALVRESIAAQQQVIADLEQKLARAKATGQYPWRLTPGCQVPRTGLPGPYTLEDWAAWTLRSLAARMGVPPADTITREHIVALVAFAWGEGGGIKGHRGQFNPLNLNGWTRLFPELGGVPSGQGTDEWPTFDAGVEATARALTNRTQNRLGLTLIDRTSTASDFFVALASPGAYEGNKNWSANDALHVGKYARLRQMVAADYTRFAGEVLRASGQLVIGVPRMPTGMGPIGVMDGPFGC
jgi:peptidoglycan hydrolase CwlO-like protein